MEGVAHLVGQGELAVQIVLVVQQHVGVGIAVAGGVGAAPLADVLIHVDPAVVEALPQQVGVVLAQHSQGLQHRFLGLLVGDGGVGVGHDGGINVVHVQLVHTHHLLAKGHVAVHLVQIVVDSLNQIQVHAHGHLSGVQRGLDGAVVAAGVGEELQLLELTVQGGSHSVLELAHALVVGVEGVFTQDAVVAHHQGHKGAVGELAGIALSVHHVGESQVGVPEGGGHVLRSVGHLAGGGQQLLLGGGEDVVLAAADLIDAAAVGLQLRLGGVEQIQRVLVDGHDLRRGEGRRAVDGHQRADGLGPHILVGAVAGVLVALAGGVAVQATEADRRLVLGAEPAQQILGAAAQRAAEGFDLLRQGLESLVLGHPGFVAAGEDVQQVPGQLLGYLTARGNGSISHGNYLRFCILKFHECSIAYPTRFCKSALP